jgi:hypothetical protein
MAKKDDQEKKPKERKGDFPEAHKEVNYIYGGPNSYEVPITFDHNNHPDFVLTPRWYPLIVSPIVKDVKLN